MTRNNENQNILSRCETAHRIVGNQSKCMRTPTETQRTVTGPGSGSVRAAECALEFHAGPISGQAESGLGFSVRKKVSGRRAREGEAETRGVGDLLSAQDDEKGEEVGTGRLHLNSVHRSYSKVQPPDSEVHEEMD